MKAAETGRQNKWLAYDGKDRIEIWITPEGVCVQRFRAKEGGNGFIPHKIQVVPFDILLATSEEQRLLFK